MKIYFSGIGGVGIGPLAEIARDSGCEVVGSDLKPDDITNALEKSGVKVYQGQDGSQIQDSYNERKIDWFVYTSALKPDHPELKFCEKNNIKISKRDELLAQIIKDKNLDLIACAGTHGKTTTTSMLIWTFQQLDIPISYSVGTTLSFGPSGKFDSRSKYFVYECDEFDRNFLNFWPKISLIISLDYDHPDTYKTVDDYRQAFVDFARQSEKVFLWEKDLRYLHQNDLKTDYQAYDDNVDLGDSKLVGTHNRKNSYLSRQVLEYLSAHDTYVSSRLTEHGTNLGKTITDILNKYPGSSRRFERLAENIYSDYAHHPTEIQATLELAGELSKNITIVYQPHQNIRQYKIKDQYKQVFNNTTKAYKINQILWLPTYLSREDPDLKILPPEELFSEIKDIKVSTCDLGDDLWSEILEARNRGDLVLAMSAGDLDGFLRQRL
jgi:UDP-N-acetylmuramate--alanine ligase